MVLDQMDGAETGFVWGIYRYLTWPDLAIVLVGDPVLCRARAAKRGLYSRFHEGGSRAAETEAALYASTAAMLTDYGYPIQIVQIGDQTADQVSETVTGLIRERMPGARTSLWKGGFVQ
jgi:dTMP kinase